MGCLHSGNMVICGDFAMPITKEKPVDWINKGYKIMVPFPFKDRPKLGKAICDCKEVLEHFAPWYGTTWYHLNDCAMMKHLKRYPGIQNLIEGDFSIIAQTD